MPVKRFIVLAVAVAQLGGPGMTPPAWAAPSAAAAYDLYDAEDRNVRAAAEQGNRRAQYDLATMYAMGEGVEKSDTEARKWYMRAAEQGDTYAAFSAGDMSERGVGGPVDRPGALRLYLMAANESMDMAQARAGRMLRTGDGVPRDVPEARRWLELAAEKDDADAQLDLALLLLETEQVVAALAWLDRATSQEALPVMLHREVSERHRAGLPTTPSALAETWASRASSEADARFKLAVASELGIGRAVDHALARAEFKALAEGGHAPAMREFARMGLEGRGGPVDPAAQSWLLKAAQRGNAAAQVDVALRDYLEYDKSLGWLRKAAAQHFTPAEAQLGERLYSEERTREEGRKWLVIAAEHGSAMAAYTLTTSGESGLSISTGTGVEADTMRWLLLAATRGMGAAQSSLGHALLDQDGGSAQAGFDWLVKAANHQDLNAASAVGECLEKGRGTPRDPAAASLWYLKAQNWGDVSAWPKLFRLIASPDAAGLPYATLVPAIRQAAARHDVWAQVILGNLQRDGLGMPADLPAAARTYALAVNEGSPEAMLALGRMLEAGEGVPADPARAAALYGRAIELGQPEARMPLAHMRRDGRGVPADPAEALALLKEADEAGVPEASAELSRMYESGQGVPQDLAEARRYLARAAERHWPGAAEHLRDFIVTGDQTHVVSAAALRPRAEAGDLEAARLLATSMLGMQPLTDASLEEGLRWMSRAAELGDAQAQLTLGRQYAQGWLVQRGDARAYAHQDKVAALAWMRKAAEGGSLEAQLVLAQPRYSSYETTPEEAFKWALKAAESGDVNGQSIVADDLARGLGTTVDGPAALRWATAAAAKHSVSAFATIALVHAKGIGVPKNPQEALKWQLKGIDAGDKEAARTLAEAYEHGRGVPKNLRRAAEFYGKSAEPYDSGAGGFDAARLYLALGDEAEALRWYLVGVDDWIEGGDGTEIFGNEGFGVMKQRYGDLPSAQFALARRFETGRGLPKDLAMATRWYTRIASFHRAYPAIAALAAFKLAASPMASAQARGEGFRQGIEDLRLGANVLETVAEVPANWDFDEAFAKAVAHLRAAALGGYAPACYAMGRLLEAGRVVPRDHALATRWLRLAAKRGHGPARFELTPTIAEGGRLAASVGDDPKRAMKAWYPEPVPKTYELALSGYVAALKAGGIGKFDTNRGSTTTLMLGTDIDKLSPGQLEGLARQAHMSTERLTNWLDIQKLEAQAARSRSAPLRFSLNRQAAEKGSSSAMREIANAYRDGDGVKADRAAAIQWATLSDAVSREKGPAIAASPAQRAAGEHAASAWWAKRHGVSLAP